VKDRRKRAEKKHRKRKKREAKLRTRETAAQVASHRPFVEPWVRWRAAAEGLAGLAERTCGHLLHASDLAVRLVAEGRIGLPSELWTLPRVAVLTDEEIVRHLAQQGVSTDEAAFRALALQYPSAIDLSRQGWRPRSGGTVHDGDFRDLASAELYRRWCPDLPTLEQIEDWRAAGGRACVSDNTGDALAAWEPLVAALRHRASPEGGGHALHVLFDPEERDDWEVSATELGWHMLQEEATVSGRLPGILHWLLESNAGDPFLSVETLEVLARILLSLGRAEEAQAMAGAWTDRYGSAWGPVALTEAWDVYDDDADPERIRAALDLLRDARDRGLADAEDAGLDGRIEELEAASHG